MLHCCRNAPYHRTQLAFSRTFERRESLRILRRAVGATTRALAFSNSFHAQPASSRANVLMMEELGAAPATGARAQVAGLTGARDQDPQVVFESHSLI